MDIKIKTSWLKTCTGKIVYANTQLVTEAKGHTFYCITPGCEAKMHRYALESPHARFSSKRIEDHKYIKCNAGNLTYSKHKYDEKKFSKDFFDFENRNNKSKSVPPSGRKRHITTKARTAPNTVAVLYAAFVTKGIDSDYNGIPIRDMFACRDNFDDKKTGFSGGHLVEATFYHSSGKSLIFNFTYYNGVDPFPKLRVIFNDKDTADKFFLRHFAGRKKMHSRLLVIAGKWEQVTGDPQNVIAQCHIYTQRQFKFLE